MVTQTGILAIGNIYGAIYDSHSRMPLSVTISFNPPDSPMRKVLSLFSEMLNNFPKVRQYTLLHRAHLTGLHHFPPMSQPPAGFQLLEYTLLFLSLEPLHIPVFLVWAVPVSLTTRK